MQIIRKDHEEMRKMRIGGLADALKAHIKTHGKSIFIITVAAAYALFVPLAAQTWSMGNQAAQSVGAAPADMRVLTDETVDTFALIYSIKILQSEEYMLTMENREKIKNLLLSMGADNIKKLNEAIYSGNVDKIVATVVRLVDENFGWEETALMAQWQ